METTYIYGKHAVLDAVKKRADLVLSVFTKPEHMEDESVAKVLGKFKNLYELNERKLPQGVGRDAVHQGFIAAIDTNKLLVPFKEFKNNLKADANTAVAVLGELEDPHNVGAIIRSAAAFGLSAVLLPEHRQAPITGTVIKVSVGTAFVVPLVSIKNVNTALIELKELGFWVYGLDMDGDIKVTEEKFEKPSVFVIGNEGRGLREKTNKHCDNILTIPIHKKTESLNASASAAVTFGFWSSRHPAALV